MQDMPDRQQYEKGQAILIPGRAPEQENDTPHENQKERQQIPPDIHR